jgi:alkylation response protein AidB-like acyl-CoA dehydrogenase
MDFAFSGDQLALRELARKILTERLTDERQKEIARSPERFDRALWSELARAGLLGAALPEAHGGGGLGLVELGLVLHEVGRAVAPLPALATLALGAQPLAELGSEEQKRRLLPGVAAGTALLSGALVELDGADPRRPQTRATRDGARWRLDGRKSSLPWSWCRRARATRRPGCS